MDVTNKHFWCSSFFGNGGDSKYLFDFDLDDSSTVFDVGSFDGDYFKILYEKYSCSIHAFEPVTLFYEKSLSSLSDKILVNNYALGSNSNDFTICLAGNASSAFSDSGEKVLCKKISFPAYVERNNITEIDLLKVNCEGGEYELLETIIENNWLPKIKNIIVQFHMFPEVPIERRQAIVDKLGMTHTPTFSFPFVWEGWRKK